MNSVLLRRGWWGGCDLGRGSGSGGGCFAGGAATESQRALSARPMQAPRCCGVQGMPSTLGNSSGPPPNTAPVSGGAGGTASLPLPLLTHTPEKSLGTVP